MKIIRKSDKSIYLKTIKLLLIATIASVAFLFIFENVGFSLLDKHYDSAKYALKENARYNNKFQSYVDKNKVRSTDSKMIDSWVRKKKLIKFVVIKNEEQVYSFSRITVEDDPDFRNNESMNIVFYDGLATVYFERAYAFTMYSFVFTLSLIIAFVLFVIIMLSGLRKELKMIKKLRDDLKVIESGNLNYEVKVQGNDEFSELADSINEMRKSLRDLFKSENDLKESNRQIVAEMSHDLRTPLTSILLYTELLKNHRYHDEAQMNQYINKIDTKATQIKEMTDTLFEYALTEYNKNINIREEDVETTFSEELSNAYGYLLDRGYKVESEIIWGDSKILMSTKYVQRIFDNLISNIEKYADINEEIKIILAEEEEYVVISIANKARTVNNGIDSNNVGLLNVSKMMEAMDGSCKVEKKNGKFKISLYFIKA